MHVSTFPVFQIFLAFKNKLATSEIRQIYEIKLNLIKFLQYLFFKNELIQLLSIVHKSENRLYIFQL